MGDDAGDAGDDPSSPLGSVLSSMWNDPAFIIHRYPVEAKAGANAGRRMYTGLMCTIL